MATFTPITVAPKIREASGQTVGRQQSGWRAWLFLMPFLVLFLIFRVYPFILGVWTSFTNAKIARPVDKFVGLDNYVRALASEDVLHAFSNTARYALIVVPLTFVISLAMALHVSRKLPGHTLSRVMFFAPYVLSVSVVAVIWEWMLQPQYGIVNWYLGMVGLPSRAAWFADRSLVLPSIAFVTAWWTAGFSMVIFLAALQDIPGELLEAAKIDGANVAQSFLRITFPLLRPASSLVLTLTIIDAFRVFSLMYIITQGGPTESSTSVVLAIFREGFTYFNLGYAAAIGVLLFLVILVVTVVRALLIRSTAV